MIDRNKDPLEQHNYYEDPAYKEIREELHQKLDALRELYGDSEEISQKYIDDFMPLAKEGKVFGVEKHILDPIIDKWENSNKSN